MWILIVYVFIVVVSESVVVGIGLALDRTFASASLPVILDVILRRPRVWLASCSALDRAQARKERKSLPAEFVPFGN